MSKYIDADKAKNGIMKFVNEYGEIVGMFVNDFNILLERCAVDAQEVVRCGECKHLMQDGRCYEFADDNIKPSVSDYCSYGERKDG